MSEGVDLRAFLAGFLAEATEHLDAANRNLSDVAAALGRREPHPRAVRELFRSLHTIKGLAAMVSVEPIVDVAHAMETVLRAADRAGGRLTAGAVDALAKGLHAIEERVAALERGESPKAAPEALLERLAAPEPAAAVQLEPGSDRLLLAPALKAKLSAAELNQLILGIESGRRALRLDFMPTPARAAAGLNITAIRERVGRVAEIVKVAPLSVPASDQAPAGLAFALLVLTDAPDALLADAGATTPEALIPLAGPAPVKEADALPEDSPDSLRRRNGYVRVDVERLDDALEKLSALVVTRFRLARAVAALGERGVDVRELVEIVNGSGRELRDLRAAIMRARMVPVGELLERVPLIVRGLARSSGKSVRVEIEAGRAELDKAVGERLFPAIVHLVRNAVDHAIEPAELRRTAGKPEEGLIRVTCLQRSNAQLELVVSDDGRGIDRAAVARRAGHEVPANDAALLDLISIPGLSTLDEATRTSGRGMGVDIVRRVCVGELGGELSLATRPGEGTSFTLRVPLSITIVEAFTLRCAGEPFVVPVSMVEEIVEVDPARILRAPSRRAGAELRLLERRGEAVPLFALDELFGVSGPRGTRRQALVIRRHGAPFAFEVDRVLGQQEVVVRPLEDALVRVPGVSGSTDLGDGRPTLVVDLLALCATAGSPAKEAA